MKTLKNLREANLAPIVAPQVAEPFDEMDDVGNTLLALNHMASIVDDLYSVIGDGDINVTPDEIDSILSAYDLLSEIHDKYDDVFSMPSQEYDLDALDVEVQEEVALQLEELELAEAAAWQMMIKTLKELGLEKATPGNNTYQSTKKIDHLFGIPMRAGKYADTYFVIYAESEGDKLYGIVDAEGTTRYAVLGDALKALKKRAKLKEELDLGEATYSFQNKMSGKVRTIKADNDAQAIAKMAKVHPVGDDALKSAKVSSVEQWFKQYYKIFKEDLNEAVTNKNIDVDIDTTFDNPAKKAKWVSDLKAKGMTAKFSGNSTLVSGPKAAVKALLTKHYGSKKEAEDIHPELKEWVEIVDDGIHEMHVLEGMLDKPTFTRLLKIERDGRSEIAGQRIPLGKVDELWLEGLMEDATPELKDQLTSFKAAMESTELAETPDRFGAAKAKLKASMDGFQKKLDSGKYPDSEESFKKMIAKLQAQLDKMDGKKEDTELDEAPMIDMIGKTCPKCGKGKYKDNAPDGYVRCDNCGDKAKRFQPDIPLSKTKGGKRILSALKKEDVDQIDEAGNQSIVFKHRDVSKLTYNPNVKSLTATFNTIGDVYYFLVQPNEWKALMADKDPLNYFTKKIKGSHKSSPASKPKSMQSEDADQIDEATPAKNSILIWAVTGRETVKPFRLDVVGQASDAIAKILQKVLPGNKGTADAGGLGFKSVGERDRAAAELVRYFKTIKEEDVQEIHLGNISEEFDENKFRRLAMTGLVPDADVASIIRAMKTLDAGKTPTVQQKNLIASTFQALIGLVTGDTSVFSKISGAAKKVASDAK